MPQALISTWLSKPKQNDVLIPENGEALIGAAQEAQNENSGIKYVVEEPSVASKCNAQVEKREKRAYQSDNKKEQGRSEDIAESANAGSENKIIPTKLHSPGQVHEQRQNVHMRFTLHSLTEQTMPAFKVLNTILPVAYSERFYSETLTCPVTAAITMVAMWNPALKIARITDEQRPSSSNGHNAVSDIDGSEILISAIRCRLLQPKPDQLISSVLPVNANTPSTNGTIFRNDSTGKPTLYICTLATKPSYRSHGAATALLESIIHRAVQSFGACVAEAHVWDGHKDALAWYLRRGFVVVKREEGYYRRLRPGAAVLVRKVVERSIMTSDTKD